MHNDGTIKPKSIRQNYLYNLIYEALILIAPLVTTPYISRVLGSEGVGIYSFTYSLAQYFVLFGNLGIATYGQMVIATAREDRKALSKTFYELFLLKCITIAASAILYLTFSALNTQYRPERFILSVYVIAAAFDISWLFRGIEDFSQVVIRNVIVKLLTVILIFVLIKEKGDEYLYVLLISVSTLIGNMAFIFPAKRVLIKVPFNELKVWRHFKQCLIFFIPTIATSVYTILDKSMLGYLSSGISQNGYYEQAHKIEQILLVAITSLNLIMRSRMSFLYNQGLLDEMRKRLDRSISFIMMISIPMCLGLIAVAHLFIPIFLGNGFDESIVLLRIFSILLIIIGLSNCLNTHFLGPSGRQGKNNYVLMGGAVINFILNFLSIPHYGAIGAAISSVVAEVFILIGYLYLSRDFFQATKLIKLGWKYIIGGVFMLGFVLVLDRLLYMSYLLKLTIMVCVGVAAYFVSLLALRDSLLISIMIRMLEKARKKML